MKGMNDIQKYACKSAKENEVGKLINFYKHERMKLKDLN